MTSKKPVLSIAKAADKRQSPSTSARTRMPAEQRERLIVEMAIKYFATHGFTGSTRDLAKELGVAQPLLYRYFPSKQALIDRVYKEVYGSRWNPEWEEVLADRSRPLEERLRVYSIDYAHSILRYDWVRIFIFAGLTDEGINKRYLDLLGQRIFKLILAELLHAMKSPPLSEQAEADALEMIWGWHSSIFYLGVRKWVYGLQIPKDLDRLIDLRVAAFLRGVPATIPDCRVSNEK